MRSLAALAIATHSASSSSIADSVHTVVHEDGMNLYLNHIQHHGPLHVFDSGEEVWDPIRDGCGMSDENSAFPMLWELCCERLNLPFVHTMDGSVGGFAPCWGDHHDFVGCCLGKSIHKRKIQVVPKLGIVGVARFEEQGAMPWAYEDELYDDFHIQLPELHGDEDRNLLSIDERDPACFVRNVTVPATDTFGTKYYDSFDKSERCKKQRYFITLAPRPSKLAQRAAQTLVERFDFGWHEAWRHPYPEHVNHGTNLTLEEYELVVIEMAHFLPLGVGSSSRLEAAAVMEFAMCRGVVSELTKQKSLAFDMAKFTHDTLEAGDKYDHATLFDTFAAHTDAAFDLTQHALLHENLPYLGKLIHFGLPNKKSSLLELLKDIDARMRVCRSILAAPFMNSFWAGAHCLANLIQLSIVFMSLDKSLVTFNRLAALERPDQPPVWPLYQWDFRFCCSRVDVVAGLLAEMWQSGEVGSRPLRVVEVGVAHGRTSKAVVELLREADVPIEYYGVDPYPMLGKDDWAFSARKEALHWFADEGFRFLELRSLEAAPHFDDDFFDFVFIDSEHSWDTADEIMSWHEKLRPGGIMSGHDFAPQWDTPKAVCKVFCELEHRTTDYRTIDCGASNDRHLFLAADYTFYWYKADGASHTSA